LKAKNSIVSGTSKLKGVIKKTAIGGAIVGGVTGGIAALKKLF
jgi:hypothetical protein